MFEKRTDVALRTNKHAHTWPAFRILEVGNSCTLLTYVVITELKNNQNKEKGLKKAVNDVKKKHTTPAAGKKKVWLRWTGVHGSDHSDKTALQA